MYFWRQLTCVLIVENWRCWYSVVSFLRLVIFKGKFHLIVTRGWRFSWFLCYPLNSVNVHGVYKQKGLCLRTGTGLVFLPFFSPPQDLQSASLVLQVLKLWSFLFMWVLCLGADNLTSFKSTWREITVRKKEKWFRIMWYIAWCLVDLAVELCNHNPIKLATTKIG